VLVKNRKHAEQARLLRNLCFQPERRFLHETLGYNYRLTNIQAAMGVGQLERIEEIIVAKRKIACNYNDAFSGIAGVKLPIEMPWARSVYWVYGVLLDSERNIDAAQVIQRLMEKGVEARPFFLGMHEQPVFIKMGLFLRETYPVTENLARNGFYLPSGLTLTNAQVAVVISALKEVLL